MLQSSNQYLRPDYLAAPNALDTKSSPLALLAQTCSAIGADTTNPKLLAANIEKSTKSLKSSMDNSRDKSSPVSSQSSSVSTGSVEQIKSSFKPYESNNNHVRERLEIDSERATNLSSAHSQSAGASGGGRVRTPKNSSGGHVNGQPQQRCDSNQSATSQRDSPAAAANNNNNSNNHNATSNGLHKMPSAGSVMDLQQRLSNSSSPQQQQHQQQRAASKESAAAQHASTPLTQSSPSSAALSQARLQAANENAIAAATKEANYVKALHAAAAAAGIPTTSAGGSVGPGSPYYPSGYGSASGLPAYSMDMMTASALMSPHHHSMFKAAALHPYLNYARLKGIDPAAMMSPNICRDPYCTGCPASPHFLNKAAGQPCPAGCPQCEGGGNKSGGSGGSSAAAAVAAAAAASSYHAQLAALAAASQLPYVCSWIGGDAAYCGKRFGTSDELFQHLRTHTASMPDSVLSAAAAGGIPPTHPLFQRTYPTPPLSPLSAARYHPYGKPSMLPPPLASGSLSGLPMPPHPALAQYFAPYSLYGPRMGSSHP